MKKRDYGKLAFEAALSLVMLLFIACAVLMGLSILTGCAADYEYEMPNGVRCTWMSTLNGQTQFHQCSDGNRYVNPEYYKQVTK